MRKIILNIALTCLVLTAHAEDLTKEQAKLKTLENEIKTLSESLEYDESKQEQFQIMLRELDMKIGEIAPELQEYNKKIRQHQTSLHLLNQDQDNAKEALEQQQSHLREQVKNAYLTQQSSLLKLLLSQSNPHEFNRLLQYYRYFNQARQTEIKKIKDELTTIAEREVLIEGKLAELKLLQQEQLKQYKELQTKQKRRESLLAQLNKDITQKGNRISQLKTDAAGLNKIIARLEKQNTQAASQKIVASKGNLIWPTHGELLYPFGSKRHDDNISWSGIFIRNKEGEPVHAVHSGRVIYADWLRGYGLLLIVDHGDNYMSLYAYNQALQKKVGDLVTANEIIATIGKSGGMPDPGLYFEIRHAGNPIDPMAWIQRQS